MPRQKKDRAVDTDGIENQDTATLSLENMATEEIPAEASETSLEATEQTDIKPEKKRRKRSPRKPKVEAIADTKTEQTPETLSATTPAIAPTFAADPWAELSEHEHHLREDVTISSAAVHKSMEVMVKQWSTIKDISDQISNRLESVHQQMLSVSNSYQEAMSELSEQVPSKPSATAPVTKIAMGGSFLAIVFSLLSLSFSHSLRHQALNHSAERVAQSAPVAAPQTQMAPTAFTQADHDSIAMSDNQDLKTKSKKRSRGRKK